MKRFISFRGASADLSYIPHTTVGLLFILYRPVGIYYSYAITFVLLLYL